jgi:putative N-acetyltransferase (TIGR04045 family)
MPLLIEKLPLPEFFTPGEYCVEQAVTAHQKAGCHTLRREVFCQEQKIFERDDRDEIDDHCLLLAASSCLFGHTNDVVGTVRIHQPAPRLARPYRRIGGLGCALIKLAVGTAKFHGAEIFLAHVQAQNRTLFELLHWHVLDHKAIHGRPHLLMQADICAYEPIDGTSLRVLPSIGIPA